MSDYTVKSISDVPDVLGDYPGEMHLLTGPLGAREVALTWRRMPSDTGSRGSYGHRHRTQEELYLVASGTLTFKLGDDVMELGPGTAVRVPPETWRGVHNDSDEDAILVICSTTIDDLAGDAETLEGFWPA
jgi:mannose-6-phosphate isomerase-like protein (cupin superfamily)